MAMIVKLAWEDDERAREFLRLRAQYMEQGYLTDSETDAVMALLTWPDVSEG